MGKNDDEAGSSSNALAVEEEETVLKRLLAKLVRAVVDNEGYNGQTISRIIEVLKKLKLMETKKRGVSLQELVVSCPEEFKCPLSKELMRDPVVATSGKTFDRPFIEKHLKSGDNKCPVTNVDLVDSKSSLTPNLLINAMITQWCASQGVDFPGTLILELDVTEEDRQHFTSLLQKLSGDLEMQREAARELRQLTESERKFRVLFHEPSKGVCKLLDLLEEGRLPLEAFYDLMTTLLNIMIGDQVNQERVGKDAHAIKVFIEGIRRESNDAAKAILLATSHDSIKESMGHFGILKCLIDIVEGNPTGIRHFAATIFHLCSAHNNIERAVKGGIVRVIMQKIMNEILINDFLPILALISSNQQAVVEMKDLGAIPLLLHFIRSDSSPIRKEHTVVILGAIFMTDLPVCGKWMDAGLNYDPMSNLAETGTPRARKKAADILKMLDMGW